jgi:hypothetical protein
MAARALFDGRRMDHALIWRQPFQRYVILGYLALRALTQINLACPRG